MKALSSEASGQAVNLLREANALAENFGTFTMPGLELPKFATLWGLEAHGFFGLSTGKPLRFGALTLAWDGFDVFSDPNLKALVNNVNQRSSVGVSFRLRIEADPPLTVPVALHGRIGDPAEIRSVWTTSSSGGADTMPAGAAVRILKQAIAVPSGLNRATPLGSVIIQLGPVRIERPVVF